MLDDSLGYLLDSSDAIFFIYSNFLFFLVILKFVLGE